MFSYLKYKFNQFISWLDRNKDRVGLLIGILGFAFTIFALYDTAKSNRNNFELADKVYQLQRLEHNQDSILKGQELFNNRPQFSISFGEGLPHTLLMNLTNDGKRDAIIDTIVEYYLCIKDDTTFLTDINFGSGLLHPDKFMYFYITSQAVDTMLTKNFTLVMMDIKFEDVYLKAEGHETLFFKMHLSPNIKTANNESPLTAELLAIPKNEQLQILYYIRSKPKTPTLKRSTF